MGIEVANRVGVLEGDLRKCAHQEHSDCSCKRRREDDAHLLIARQVRRNSAGNSGCHPCAAAPHVAGIIPAMPDHNRQRKQSQREQLPIKPATAEPFSQQPADTTCQQQCVQPKTPCGSQAIQWNWIKRRIDIKQNLRRKNDYAARDGKRQDPDQSDPSQRFDQTRCAFSALPALDTVNLTLTGKPGHRTGSRTAACRDACSSCAMNITTSNVCTPTRTACHACKLPSAMPPMPVTAVAPQMATTAPRLESPR